MASISSMKMIAGAASLACSNRSRTRDCAHADDHLDELRRRHGEERHAGLARHGAASSVLPVPGGPMSRTPCGTSRRGAGALRLAQELDELCQLLVEIVDFLREPESSSGSAGGCPQGVLLIGPPGTGKTLLARAVAGEAGVPFFSMSALGVHRDVRRRRRRRASATCSSRPRRPPLRSSSSTSSTPSAARARRRGARRRHDEREQTLNQILTEMDGFDRTTGVIVLAATNRPDVLDPALLRPGRFDRRVHVQPPDKAGAGRSSRSTPAPCRSPPTSTSTPSPPTTPGHGRRRPGQPGQRGGAAGRPARHDRSTCATSPRRWRRSCSAPSASILIDRRGPAPHGLPRGGPRARRHAHARRRPGTQGDDHPARQALGVTFSARSSTASTTTSRTCGPASAWRWAAAPPRRSCSATITTGAENDIEQVTEIARANGGALGDERDDRPDGHPGIRRRGPAAARCLRRVAGHSAARGSGGTPHPHRGAR